MALIENELTIEPIKSILKLKLSIPKYQRPYRWSVKSANTLFSDIYQSYKENVLEYRIGSIILHKQSESYDVVDGQQRLSTLSILSYCLDDRMLNGLLEEKYKEISINSILDNYNLLKNKVSQIDENERESFKQYLFMNCTIVKIVTDNEQEAFQFFDSQNSRGKELAPHDLLKSYHLREMNDEEEHVKIKIINEWESKESKDLEEVFKFYLFPLTQWYRCKDGLGYSAKDIEIFKGIKLNSKYNYGTYHKAANLFIEQMNNNGSIELFGGEKINQFQLTEPLIAGKRFFAYTMHYLNLLDKIKEKVEKLGEDIIPSKRTGDIYTKRLYESAILFFADRFGIEKVDSAIMKKLYMWSYSLRLVMEAIYPQTINKYAIGKHERANQGLDLFAKINEMKEAQEIYLITLEDKDIKNVKDNYSEIEKIMKEERAWGQLDKNQ